MSVLLDEYDAALRKYESSNPKWASHQATWEAVKTARAKIEKALATLPSQDHSGDAREILAREFEARWPICGDLVAKNLRLPQDFTLDVPAHIALAAIEAALALPQDRPPDEGAVERVARYIQNWRDGNAGENTAEDTARLVLSALSTPSPDESSIRAQAFEEAADSGMDGESVERAEWVWAQLPVRIKWTSLTTAEKALVCRTLARVLKSTPTLSEGGGE